jgi:hypothetical protein
VVSVTSDAQAGECPRPGACGLFINGRRHLGGHDEATPVDAPWHRDQDAMPMASCIHLNQVTLAFVAAT